VKTGYLALVVHHMSIAIMLIDMTHQINYPVENYFARGIKGEISSDVVA